MPHSQDIAAYEKKYNNGEIIIKAGDKGNEFFYVISGRVGVYVNYGQPDQIKITELKDADFFGEAAIIGNTLRSATVVSLTDTVVRVIPLDNIAGSVESNPEIYLSLIKNFYNNQNKRNADIQLINTLLTEICGINEETIALNTKIVECLNEIQTISRTNNILGINASIESARAGSFGKGFVIVAQELQRLAVRTSAIANQSRELIDECKANSIESAGKLNSAREFLEKFR